MPSISSSNINQTSFRGIINGLAFPANYYEYFEIELWNADATIFYYANNWTDSSGVNYYSYSDFSGLSASTTYTIKGFVKSSGGSRTFVGSTTVTTATPPLPAPGAMGTIFSNPGDTNIIFSWNAVSNDQWYDVTVRVGNSSGAIVYTNSSVFSTSVNVTGLLSNTTYWVGVVPWNSTSSGPSNSTTATTTSPPTPNAPLNLNAVVSNGTEVTLTWDAVSNADSYSAEIYLKDTSTVVASAYSFNGLSKKFTGLTANTEYTAKVYGNNTYGPGTASYKGFSTSKTRPLDWTWSTLKSSAQTDPSKIYVGIIPLVIVDATEWNQFTARINEFRLYKLGAGKAYSFTSATKGLGVGALYNEAVTAITPMATVSQTGGVYSKLVALENALKTIQ